MAFVEFKSIALRHVLQHSREINAEHAASKFPVQKHKHMRTFSTWKFAMHPRGHSSITITVINIIAMKVIRIITINGFLLPTHWHMLMCWKQKIQRGAFGVKTYSVATCITAHTRNYC